MMKTYLRHRKTALTYFKAHPEYNATVHALGGISVGVLLARPLFDPHPLRWAVVFALLSIGGHVYALAKKK
jgi:hypothetical protein